MKKQQKQDRTAERGRFSAKRKKEAVLRLLKGEELDALTRELGVTAAVLSEWREKFLAGAEANLKSREPELETTFKKRGSSNHPSAEKRGIGGPRRGARGAENERQGMLGPCRISRAVELSAQEAIRGAG
ncbi:transposase [Myxococcus landrumensis]|uniref:Transposase n=1 Tax=Myxococcus landrumensis TaxID=2813577 RepID=A0ABX7NGF6_9BACT|nr:transposase [Myxococcus landrumus]